MKKILKSIKEFFTPSEEQMRKLRYQQATDGAKNYCYYSEDGDGNPTVAISGDNVFTIVEGDTNLSERKLNVADAIKFLKSQREEYTSSHFNDTVSRYYGR